MEGRAGVTESYLTGQTLEQMRRTAECDNPVASGNVCRRASAGGVSSLLE